MKKLSKRREFLDFYSSKFQNYYSVVTIFFQYYIIYSYLIFLLLSNDNLSSVH